MVAYWARFFREEGGGYSVDVPDCPGCLTHGDTFEEAYRYLVTEALPAWLGNGPCPPTRGPEAALAAKSYDNAPVPLLALVELGKSDAVLPASLAADFARAATASGEPVGELLIRAAVEFLERHPVAGE